MLQKKNSNLSLRLQKRPCREKEHNVLCSKRSLAMLWFLSLALQLLSRWHCSFFLHFPNYAGTFGLESALRLVLSPLSPINKLTSLYTVTYSVSGGLASGTVESQSWTAMICQSLLDVNCQWISIRLLLRWNLMCNAKEGGNQVVATWVKLRLKMLIGTKSHHSISYSAALRPSMWTSFVSHHTTVSNLQSLVAWAHRTCTRWFWRHSQILSSCGSRIVQ